MTGAGGLLPRCVAHGRRCKIDVTRPKPVTAGWKPAKPPNKDRRRPQRGVRELDPSVVGMVEKSGGTAVPPLSTFLSGTGSPAKGLTDENLSHPPRPV